jgi:uncharacterized protein YoxC
MSGIVSVAILILCAAVIILVIYLIGLAARLRLLTDDLRKVTRDQVVPLLTESREVVSKCNSIAADVVNTVDSAKHVLGQVKSRAEEVNPSALGRKLGFEVAKKATIWLAGLGRAAAAVRGKRKEE